LTTNEPLHRNITEVLPTNTPPSQPYWLQEEGTVGMFRVKDLSLIGRPENPPVFPVQYIFEVGGQKLVVDDEPVQLATDSAKARRPQRLEVIPPVSLRFASEVELFGREKAKTVSIDVTAARPHTTGVLELVAPAGWAVTPKSSLLNLAAAGDHVRVSFVVTAPANPSTASFSAVAEVNGMRCDNQRIEIRYDHLPTQLLQPPARLKAICLDLEIRGKRIGYLPGAGDDVAGCLEHMGYTVTRVTGEDLVPEKLGSLDAVVVGIRAFNVREDLGSRTTNLFAYAENGGTVIVQYNRPDGLKSTKLAPFDLRLSQERVTDENAAVTFLAPDHAVLNVPNKISPADFEGWVQERGVYFPNEWDKRFVPILACNDAGESPKNGGLLVAQVGRGYFVYTGLAWFRQLPAGVPGAYRLFANLVSLGK
ncbi:MAG TPA: LmbE family protein, partial [Candidatus Limnocylindria bacterium]|nr:LmbE family protein [Candidatus Limnocylindria bacterium]